MKIVAFTTALCGALLGAGTALAQEAAGEATPAATKTLMPEMISTFGGEIDFLFYLILWITTAVALLVLGLLGYSLVVFRHSDKRRATYTHGSSRLEIGWTVATAAILIFIAFAQQGAWSRIKYYLPEENEAFLVRIFAERFAWNFVYPGPDGTFEANDDSKIFPGINPLGLEDYTKDIVRTDLVVPVDRPIVLELISKGKFDPNTGQGEVPVLHSFFSPHLRVKQDIVPYFPQKIWFQATQEGTYEIVCAELCGEGHYQMGAQMRVMSEEEVSAALGYDWQAPGTFPARFRANDEDANEGTK